MSVNSGNNAAVRRVSKIVSEIAGIQLGEKQNSMVENRLRSRMMKLQLDSEQEYLEYLNDNKEQETEALLSLLTTHHTYFFREFSQFEYLLNYQLKHLIQLAEKRGDNKIRIWSAACSRGQEVYSLAMFFDYHLKATAPHIDFEVYGTDIDAESVEIAKNGVYKTAELHKSPAMYVSDHWVQGKESVKEYSKVKKALKEKCHFSVLNLLKVDNFNPSARFDLIFCRNVFIYFNLQQIESISKDILQRLDPEGLLILGISESLQGLPLGLESIGPSAYGKSSVKPKTAAAPAVIKTPNVVHSRPLEILCVDDSPVIHRLLAGILTRENGFIIKDKAMNGEEALKLLKEKKYDAITLDLHMPIIDGVSFLKQRSCKTPTIILSSISREEESIAQQALSLGAADYVQKPTLENLINSGNEIRSKLKSIVKPTTTTSAVSTAKTNSVKTAQAEKIKTLIVDDSETIRNLLQKILSKDPVFEVVAAAKDSIEAEASIQKCRPDLITLDIHMPGKNGIEFLKDLQTKMFIPTVMISSYSLEDGAHIFEALSAGAIDYIKKPELHELEKLTPIIHEKLKSAAAAKKFKNLNSKKVRASREIDNNHIVLIGSSTGGVEALKNVFESMPTEIPPTVVVQHIPAVFSKAFAERLNTLVSFEVREAVDGDEVLPNRVLIAPGGKQMGLKSIGDKIYVKITDDPAMNRHRPSVDYLFKSAADLKLKNGTAIILTGMGADGSKELARLKNNGFITVAQDESTSVVFGMPKEAIATGKVDFILPLGSIAEKIISLATKIETRKTA